MGEPTLRTHLGGCHCGAVAWKVDAPERPTVLECACSICRMTGYLHLIVPSSRFFLLLGEGELVEYRFNTGTARHLFCRRCGIKSFYVPRSHPGGYSVNVRCLTEPLDDAVIAPFDDDDREAATQRLAHLTEE